MRIKDGQITWATTGLPSTGSLLASDSGETDRAFSAELLGAVDDGDADDIEQRGEVELTELFQHR